MPPVRVLYVHGIESGPQNCKVHILRAQGFDVRCEDMFTGKFQLFQKNSIVRHLLRLPETKVSLSAVFLSMSSMYLEKTSSKQPSLGRFCLLASCLFIAFRIKNWIKSALTNSMERCVEIQQQALLTHRPSLIIASSWGGVIAAELILRQSWGGPTCFLAPAIFKVYEMCQSLVFAQEKAKQLREISSSIPMSVFHDRKDAQIPFHDSERLCQGSDSSTSAVTFTLHEMPDNGHHLVTMTHNGILQKEIYRLLGS